MIRNASIILVISAFILPSTTNAKEDQTKWRFQACLAKEADKVIRVKKSLDFDTMVKRWQINCAYEYVQYNSLYGDDDTKVFLFAIKGWITDQWKEKGLDALEGWRAD